MKDLSVVLVSGGMDSCVCAAIAALDFEMAFLHFNYGQLTQKRELEAFNNIAEHYGVQKRLVVDVTYLKDIGGSALTDERIPVPTVGGDALSREAMGEISGDNACESSNDKRFSTDSKKQIPPTYVPFRNAHLLSAATSWAEAIGAKRIFIGAVEEDSSGYPDCRETFYAAFQDVIDKGTKPDTDIKIITPLIHLNKADIVNKGVELNAPLNLTWSCYKENEIACGVCESCILRLRGFKETGTSDPIPYKKRM